MTNKRFLAVSILALALVILLLGVTATADIGGGSISGRVYCDKNGNGSFDPGEGMSDVPVFYWQYQSCDPTTRVGSGLEGVPSSAIQGTVSGPDGAYTLDFLSVDPGGGDTCFDVYVPNDNPELGFCVVPLRKASARRRPSWHRPQVIRLHGLIA